ncbi:type II toxin-antitoxin system antitoxin HipB [Vibrio parahaemolyticus]|uniref:type II toxin-antitoxin system antitoxin HipB n=1 Tax=Vibrio parahaemolyticus TaxID=670 RepID=UPI001D3C9BDC|nr:type II toxin-antitoxin system antitoxin HipB [Vibrio parahaemolyticus]EGQ8508552.1 type II toxin-antitoxin system antitoxin HipB [Vibrio parahaemolyticus]ELI5394931.1 type II toxin-antitoxin system antitoxin HipB [Vibrio parahaemolyticus]MCR9693414.1 type II toxin-antitoxin system antitoxin HipB [Vibrio parahaemolyticus]MCR9763604.1 type II toxin-antitoxin system antitoxin HipB [Vibrio parahaemolyticus]MDF4932726.1 type II toxin-antitoxin system antitoxin HipB [Vibrio parahaemolyticus]
MIYSPKQLADRMLLIRQKNRWSQSELAKKVGLKQSTISNFENNPSGTTLSTFFKLLQSMELTISIYERNHEPESNTNSDEDW